jgi:hypothetical protein
VKSPQEVTVRLSVLPGPRRRCNPPERQDETGFVLKPAVLPAAAFAALWASSVAVAASPTAAKCPSASVVSAELKESLKAPTSTVTTYGKTCTYEGTGIIATKIEFQVDTPATFSTSEKAVAAVQPIVKVKGLGQAAWTTKVGGDLQVFSNGETIKILAPLVSAAKLEALAHKIM